MLYFLMLCCGNFVYVQERGNHPAVYLVSLSSSHSAHFILKCHGGFRDFREVEQHKPFPHHILCYQEMRK